MIVASLMSMGLTQSGCERAAVATVNAGVQEATNYYFSHSGDAGFFEPLPGSARSGAGGGAAFSPAQQAWRAALDPADMTSAFDTEALVRFFPHPVRCGTVYSVDCACTVTQSLTPSVTQSVTPSVTQSVTQSVTPSTPSSPHHLSTPSSSVVLVYFPRLFVRFYAIEFHRSRSPSLQRTLADR